MFIRISVGIVLVMFIAMVMFPSVATALYISEYAEVKLYMDSSLSGAPAARIKPGSKIELLERDGSVVKIQTEEGLTGWLEVSYVSEQAPASGQKDNDLALRLKETQSELERLRTEQALIDQNVKDIGWMKVELKRAREKAKKFEGLSGSIEEEKAVFEAERKQLQQENNDLKTRLNASFLIEDSTGGETPTDFSGAVIPETGEATAGNSRLIWLLAACLVIFIAGVIAGVLWLDFRIRKRHGGFRVY